MKGEEVKRRRKALGWTQATLGEKVGVVQSAISALERGGPIGDDVLAKIKSALLTAAGSPVASEEIKVETRVESPSLEKALGAAFDPTRHLLRDTNAVLEAFGKTKLPRASDVELRALCAQWLDAAAVLRGDGAEITPQAISAQASLTALRAASPSADTKPDTKPTASKKTRAA